MTYLSVEEYRVRLNKESKNIEGKMWLREGQEWEVEIEEGGARLTATAQAEESDRLPHHLFTRVIETLAAADTRIFACGTCVNFRRSPSQQARGWLGYCSYRGDHAEAPPYP
ncbi:MAG: hypothetical protein H0T73_19365, partial [Ardenticatenales bacterium]|nr:hypothetical protein [Ardenticatenales bacterium]